MAKKKSWFNLLKRFFISDTLSKAEKKEKRRGWMIGRLKIKRLASITAPPSPSREAAPCEVVEEQRKHAVTVAIATAAAAEAAISAAQVAAEVVRLTSTPQSTYQYNEDGQEFSSVNFQTTANQSFHQYQKDIQNLAATKIQTAFRGYLARKALRALKGLVRLQAIIRGRAVRRQAITTLKCLQSIVNIQSHICARRCEMVEGARQSHENEELDDFRDKEIKIDSNSQRRWDDSLLTKEEAKALFLSKREALIKRERIKEYTSHRKSSESEQNKVHGRWRYWLEQWVDTQLAKEEDLKTTATVFTSSAKIKDEFGGRQLKLKNSPRLHHIEGLDSPMHVSRRSFHHKKQHSIGDGNSFAGSPVVPTYMAATESAKAKARSMSSPRLRPVCVDAYSETNSPYKYKLSPMSSVNSEVMSSRTGNTSGFQQRSPCLKGLPGIIKSSRTLKELSFDSECPLRNWEHVVPSANSLAGARNYNI